MNEKCFAVDIIHLEFQISRILSQTSGGTRLKKISGMVPATPTRPEDIRSQLHINDIDGKSDIDITDLINTGLLEPMQGHQPLDSLPPIDEN